MEDKLRTLLEDLNKIDIDFNTPSRVTFKLQVIHTKYASMEGVRHGIKIIISAVDKQFPERPYHFFVKKAEVLEEDKVLSHTEALLEITYYEFLKYLLFAKRYELKDAGGYNILVIPIADLIKTGIDSVE